MGAAALLLSTPSLPVPNRPIPSPLLGVSSSHPSSWRPLLPPSPRPLPISSRTFPTVANASANRAPAEISAVGRVLASTGAEVVQEFYDGINCRDLASVGPLIAEDCVYEDLIFSSPFSGRKAILEFFEKFMDNISSDLQFVVDDISKEDTQGVGVTWHLEWKGKPFPFSKGCSFYRLDLRDGKRQIVYGRDIVEPAIKPGESALVIIRGVTWIFQRFPQLADWM